MGLAGSKGGVFSKIGSYNSMNQSGNMPKQKNSFTSVNNKKDVIPFLLQILKIVAGTVVLKLALGKLFTKVIDDSEKEIKEELKKQFNQPELDKPLGETDFGTDGIDIPVKDIDSNGLLSQSSDTVGGDLLYGESDNPNRAFEQAINTGSEVTLGDMTVKYDSVTETFKMKPIAGIAAGLTLGFFIGKFIDNTKLFDKKELLSATMDSIFGSITSTTDKTEDQIRKELEATQILENLLAGDESLEINQNELDKIFQKAKQMKNGVVYLDMGCGIVESKLPLSGLTNLVGMVSGSTDSFMVGNAISSVVKSSVAGDVGKENQETIEDGFIEKIINTLTVKMLEKVTMSPQVKMLLGIASSVTNQGEAIIGKAKDDIKRFKTCIKCMKIKILKMVAGFLFALAVSYLVKLLSPIIKKIVKEKIEIFKNQLKGFIASKIPTTG